MLWTSAMWNGIDPKDHVAIDRIGISDDHTSARD